MVGTRVTVVVPTLNERHSIRDCLTDLCHQDAQPEAILVVDGMSDDGTRAIVADVAAHHPHVRLVDNPGRTAAAAMNVGLREVQTELLVRADAHARYAPDYVRRNVEVKDATGAVDVGGPMRPVGTTTFGRAVAAATTSKVGMGSGAFHWTEVASDVDTVYLGCYAAADLRAVGGWDAEALQWAAEDQELNFRLRDRGGTIRCDPTIRSWYFPRGSVRALWRQYHNYGMCKASTLKKHRRVPTARAVAPAALVSALGGSALLAVLGRRRPLAALAGSWGGALALEATRLARKEAGAPAPHVLLALGICHVGHGTGFLRGLGRWASGRPFDVRPPTRR